MFKDIVAHKLFDKYTDNNFLGESSIVEIDDFLYMGQYFYVLTTMYIDPYSRQCGISGLTIRTGDEFDEEAFMNFTHTDLEKKIESLIKDNKEKVYQAKRLNISI